MIEQECIKCGYRFDTDSKLDNDSTPSPNDITLCLFCGQAYTFSNDMNRIAIKDSELPPKSLREINRIRFAIAYTMINKQIVAGKIVNKPTVNEK